jgi:hypothetical protein
MHTFAEVSEEIDLKPFLTAHVGQLYVPRSFATPRPLIRHFNSARIAGLVGSYAEVVAALDRWVVDRTDVADLVEVLGLTEIGVDFVSRPFRGYYYALEGYDNPEEWDLVDVIPEELGPMRERVQDHLVSESSGRDEVLQEVVAASLLGPSPTTTFPGPKWLVVSPSVSIEQLERWAVVE